MNPERWHRIKKLFDSALHLQPQEQADFLARSCGEDAALRREVEALLANHSQADRFMEKLASVRTESLKDPQLGSIEGHLLGAYKVLDPIGRGGMGDVYLAERSDDQYHQRVAIKLIKLGMDSELLKARFRLERQILASLDHPSIARLLDGGTLADGRPYLVMEYIEGDPIDRYCERHQLGLRQRLQLFRKVCEAVQYAHRNLVIHRDLKPSNVLVTANGTPKLLDFGTAKLLQTSESERPATATELRLLTPGYASPEQLKGGAITTASDVYALGVVLYELLTGRRPFRFQSPMSPEVVRVVCEEKPPRPSTLAKQSQTEAGEEAEYHLISAELIEERWLRRLQGDLDNILLMALRKEPARRYATVEQFSEDVRRHLESLPVLARPDTAVYRATKFVRRNRASVAATVLVFLVLIVAVVVTTAQARRAEDERRRAQEVTDFLVRLLEASDPGQSQGKDVTVRELLDEGAERVKELDGSLDLQAKLLDTMGFVYFRLGAYDRAAELLEDALEIHRKEPLDALDLAEVLDNLGQVLRVRGDLGRSGELLQQALALRRRHLEAPAPDIAETLSNLGVYEHSRGDLEAARAWHEEALAMRRALPRVEPARMASSLNNLGATLLKLGELEAAARLLSEAIERRQELFDEDHPDLVNSLNNLGAVRLAQREPEVAEGLFQDALAMAYRLFRDNHREIANAHHNLGMALRKQKRFGEAEEHYRRALEMRQSLLDPGHPEVGRNLRHLGDLFVEQARFDAAIEVYRQACEVFEREGEGHDLRDCLHSLGWTRINHGDYAGAVPVFERLIPLQHRVLKPEDPALATDLLGLGVSLLRSGDPQGAESYLQQALAIRLGVSATREDRDRIASAQGLLAECLIDLERYREAEPLAIDALSDLSTYGDADARSRQALQRIIRLYEAWGRPDQTTLFRQRLAGTDSSVNEGG
ncbi:MAG: serine/threonine-protein kinase [Acidobacteriota bacterium]